MVSPSTMARIAAAASATRRLDGGNSETHEAIRLNGQRSSEGGPISLDFGQHCCKTGRISPGQTYCLRRKDRGALHQRDVFVRLSLGVH